MTYESYYRVANILLNRFYAKNGKEGNCKRKVIIVNDADSLTWASSANKQKNIFICADLHSLL
jgi:hypothetical protein